MDLQSPEAAWDYLVGQLFHQRSQAFEEVRAAVMAASVPMPAEIVERIAHLNAVDAREILRAHPGYDLWERHKSYQVSYQVFERATLDLLKAIQHFNDLARDGTLFGHTRRNEIDEMEQLIQKELFAAANAAHSLVDHSTRRVQKIANVPDYAQHLQRIFGSDGLHEFVIALRTMLHHIHALQPGYLWQSQLGKGTHVTTAFVFEKQDVVRAAVANQGGFSTAQFKKVTTYITAAPDNIDVALVFEDYRRRAAAFHSWFGEALRAHAFGNVRDYDRCLLENRRFAAQTWWNCLLGNWLRWPTPPNPYNHLATYLTPTQIDEVLRLPKRSAEQVDKVIAFIDVDGACTDHIRQQAYELFRRAAT